MFGFAAIGALAVPFVILAAIYAMLEYHRSPMSIATVAIDELPSAVNRRPRRFLLIGLLLSAISSACLFGLVLYVSTRQGPPGPQGSHGEQGIQGPRGAAAPLDQKAVERAAVIDSMATVSWLEYRRAQFRKIRDQYDLIVTRTLDMIAKARDKQDLALPVHIYTINGFSDSLIGMAKVDFSKAIILNDHPNFGANPLAPMSGDEKITNEEIKGTYRRIADEHNTAINTLNTIEKMYDHKIQTLQDIIFNFAQTEKG